MSARQFERREPTLGAATPEADLDPFAPPRSRLAPDVPDGKLLPYQKAGRVIRLMAWLGVLGTVGIGVATLLPAISNGDAPPVEFVVMLSIFLAIAVALFFVAGAVMRHRTWGRYAGIAYGLMNLPGVPLGTLVGGYILWQLIAGWGKGDADR